MATPRPLSPLAEGRPAPARSAPERAAAQSRVRETASGWLLGMPPRPRRLTCCRWGQSRAAGTRSHKLRPVLTCPAARQPLVVTAVTPRAATSGVSSVECGPRVPPHPTPSSPASLSLRVPSSHSLNVARPRRARARSAVTPGCLDCSGPDDGLRVRDRAGRASPREHTVFCRGVWTRPTPRGPLSTRLQVFKSPAHARVLLAIAGVLAATSLGQ